MPGDGEGRLDAGELFRRHAKFVTRVLVRLGVDLGDLDDLVQEVFLVAHRKGGFVHQSAQPRTWLAEIAFRVVSTARRTEKRRQQRITNAAAVASTESPPPLEGQVEALEALRHVDRVLLKMDLDHRIVFVLFEIEGERADEIAAALGIPLRTVYSRLHAARKMFVAAHARRRAIERGSEAGLPEGKGRP